VASNISGGDFDCCGSWAIGCAAGKGCMYCSILTDEVARQEALLHAMQHCTAFKKIYLEPDQAYIKAWTSQIDAEGNMVHVARDITYRTKPTRAKEVSKANDIVDKLSGKYGDAEIADLLALLGM